ncbi:MAG: hypothetical protein AAB490_02225 [Patescibacteria group bacterium]
MNPLEQPHAAEGDELTAFELEQFIRNYVPRGWVEPLHVSTSGPMLTAEEIQEFRNWHASGKLPEELQKRYKQSPAIVEAIIDYFERKKEPS